MPESGDAAIPGRPVITRESGNPGPSPHSRQSRNPKPSPSFQAAPSFPRKRESRDIATITDNAGNPKPSPSYPATPSFPRKRESRAIATITDNQGIRGRHRHSLESGNPEPSPHSRQSRNRKTIAAFPTIPESQNHRRHSRNPVPSPPFPPMPKSSTITIIPPCAGIQRGCRLDPELPKCALKSSGYRTATR